MTPKEFMQIEQAISELEIAEPSVFFQEFSMPDCTVWEKREAPQPAFMQRQSRRRTWRPGQADAVVRELVCRTEQ